MIFYDRGLFSLSIELGTVQIIRRDFVSQIGESFSDYSSEGSASRVARIDRETFFLS